MVHSGAITEAAPVNKAVLAVATVPFPIVEQFVAVAVGTPTSPVDSPTLAELITDAVGLLAPP